MLVVALNMPEHSSFQDMLFPMLFISKYAKSYASIMDISLSGSLDFAQVTHQEDLVGQIGFRVSVRVRVRVE